MKDKINELVGILSMQSDVASYKRFIEAPGAYLTRDSIKAILALDDSVQNKYDYLYRLAWITFGELQGPHFGQKQNFKPPEDFCRLQKFLYSWDFLSRKQTIPFEEWSDIAEEGLELVKQYFDKNVKSFEQLPGYEPFVLKFGKRVTDLVNSGKYDDEFHEWGKDN